MHLCAVMMISSSSSSSFSAGVGTFGGRALAPTVAAAAAGPPPPPPMLPPALAAASMYCSPEKRELPSCMLDARLGAAEPAPGAGAPPAARSAPVRMLAYSRCCAEVLAACGREWRV